MSEAIQIQTLNSEIIITDATLTNSAVADFYRLHEQVRMKTGKNLRPKTIDNIRALVFNETMIGAWVHTDHLVGMMSAQRIRQGEYAKDVSLLIDKDPQFKKTHANNAVEFNSCAVHEDACQSGIASRLLQYCMTRAKEKGAQYGLAKVWAENTGGQKVFERAGFKHHATTHREDGTPLLVFAREL